MEYPLRGFKNLHEDDFNLDSKYPTSINISVHIGHKRSKSDVIETWLWAEFIINTVCQSPVLLNLQQYFPTTPILLSLQIEFFHASSNHSFEKRAEIIKWTMSEAPKFALTRLYVAVL